MKKNNIIYIVIIAFLLGIIFQDHCWSLKVPDVILQESIDPDLRETIERIITVINQNRYTMKVSSAAISASDELEEGEFMLDNNGVTKRLCISNGTNNYYVNLTQL